jgi:hypothetical protein
VAPVAEPLNGNVLILLLLLSSIATETKNLPAKRSFTPPARTACALVTRADVEGAIGRQVADGSEETEGPASTCDYPGKFGMVSFTIQRLTGKLDIQAEIAALKKKIPQGIVREADGFADAFYFDLPGAGTQLHILDGGSSHLMISILGFGDAPEVSTAAAQIAGKAMRRL